MLSIWSSFAGWTVLEYFLANPSKSAHTNGLARIVNVSSQTSHRYLNKYYEQGILTKEKIGNSTVFSLVLENTVTQALRRLWFLNKIEEEKLVKDLLEINPSIEVITLYGPYASGEFTGKDPAQILIITSKSEEQIKPIESFEKKTNHALNIISMELSQWLREVHYSSTFAEMIKHNHIILYSKGKIEAEL